MMASAAVVNNLAALSPDSHFLDCPQSPAAAFPSYGWLSPSRISFSRDLSPPEDSATSADEHHPEPDPAGKDIVLDFEFHLHDPVSMLPADELFSDGKLVPLQLATTVKRTAERPAVGIRSPDSFRAPRKVEISRPDPYVFSPRAPRCTTGWRELLGLKRPRSPKPAGTQNASSAPAVIAATSSSRGPNHRYLRNLLHRSAKQTSLDSALSLPLRDSETESLSISSSRLSLSSSSSSSGPDHEDPPHLTRDSELKAPGYPPVHLRPRTSTSYGGAHLPPASRACRNPLRGATELLPQPLMGVNIDSPRMSPSGKIVFQGLERSSSSPGSFTGGPRPRSRGIERSYSAHVRVAPVLNVVPVCSLRSSTKLGSVLGLSQMFSPQKKDKDAPAQNASNRPRTPQSGPNRCGSSKTKTIHDRTPKYHNQKVNVVRRDHDN